MNVDSYLRLVSFASFQCCQRCWKVAQRFIVISLRCKLSVSILIRKIEPECLDLWQTTHVPSFPPPPQVKRWGEGTATSRLTPLLKWKRQTFLLWMSGRKTQTRGIISCKDMYFQTKKCSEKMDSWWKNLEVESSNDLIYGGTVLRKIRALSFVRCGHSSLPWFRASNSQYGPCARLVRSYFLRRLVSCLP